MMYGNYSNGYGYSPDRSYDVDHSNLHSQFINARGSRQTGYYSNNYYSSNNNYQTSNNQSGHYDGRGQWVKD